ncbi:Transcriptional adapter 3-B [Trachymyrmex septentrionalis]|uniref:Transcriptional adapter 3-B n=1 Tax=Trachymyrmex septentrionalis TaxID=34720 RepID=A0A195EVL5_9HYME|nr:PREDICTED: transcriptional adapter 3-B [Trachymyrmex septentrionalis]XP_018352791.1 PREDICTED: transcriptional adapter 3-B [Trachymyrmex septentrionalis]XP_018352792.1 PREDICTED: transcriptional adapter 3-B [Trachymyrmex septentrionalis]KYN32283.1 Transcriptional adapter 3-B [Trachymyrmex septentrionalis]
MSGKGKQSSKKAVIKIRESGKTAQSSTMNSDASSEVPEPTTSQFLLKTVDNSRHLPRYTSILKRTAEEGVVMDDLDTLQLELETLLSAVVVRHRTLQDEIASLFSAEERKDRRSKSSKSLSLLDKKIREEKFKPKEINTKSQSPLHTKLFKQKTVGSSTSQVIPTLHEMSRIEGSKSDVPKLLLPKNDTPNKFWASVDSYCTDIMPDDIKLLEELIATHGDINEFKKISPLGRHYSLMWAHNDLLQEEDAANSNREKKKNRTDMSHLISKGDKKTNSIAGPLTQRLVSALLEENVYVANNNMENKLFRDGDPPVLRDLTIQNSMNLELRMHKELVEQGILEPDVQKKHQEDDEILAEIKRCQQELVVLSNHNVTELKRLLNLAQEESKRQALKRKINVADNDVIEHYKKLSMAKQRKVPLTRKDHEKAWACLRERENLLEQLNITK